MMKWVRLNLKYSSAESHREKNGGPQRNYPVFLCAPQFPLRPLWACCFQNRKTLFISHMIKPIIKISITNR